MTEKRFVVIGGDAAGMSAASLAKRRQPDLNIEAYEMGDYTSYGACGMPYYVAGQVPELDDLVVVTPRQFEEKRGIKVFMRHRVEKILPGEKTIEVRDLTTDALKKATYDELLIATGARPVVPPGIDLDLPGVFTLRGLPDAEAIRRYARDNNCREGLVVGTGYIGMEMAEALAALGLTVTILGRNPRVMKTYEEEIGAAVVEELENQSVRLLSGAAVDMVEQTADGKLKATRTTGDSFITDLIVIGAGVVPRSELAGEAGLKLGSHKAIWVDRRQRTSEPNIWSAGDCAEAYHMLLKKNAYVPLALTANRAGRVAGSNIVGLETEFPGILGSAVCKIFDLTVVRTGLGLEEALKEGYDAAKAVVVSRSRPHYYPGGAPVKTVLIVEKGSRKVLGAQMAGLDGVAHRINTFAAALAAGFSLDEIHNLDLAYAPPYSPVWDPVINACEIAGKKIK